MTPEKSIEMRKLWNSNTQLLNEYREQVIYQAKHIKWVKDRQRSESETCIRVAENKMLRLLKAIQEIEKEIDEDEKV